MAEKTFPKWKKDDVLYCSDCEIVVTKNKALTEEDWLQGEAIYACPGCDKELGKPEKK